MSIRVLPCLLASWALVASASAEQFYKWTDAQGVTHYTSTPPPKEAASAAGAVTVSRAPTPAAPADATESPTEPGTDANSKPGDVEAENARRKQEHQQQMCAYARKQYDEMQRYGNRRVVETRGEQRDVALPAERIAESGKWQAEINKYCQ